MERAYINWSSGKDAALALFKIQKEGEYTVEKLVTSVASEGDRISMHGIRRELLEKQAQSLNIPLKVIYLPKDPGLEQYNKILFEAITELKAKGVTHSVFGDIFLEDLRQYREKELLKVNITAVFPLWKKNTLQILKDFIDLGFKAVIICVNANFLSKSFCGRTIDKNFIEDLPDGVDPCGENGEFHTFVYDGPNFNFPIYFEVGEIFQKLYKPEGNLKDNVSKDRKISWDTDFWYCDLIPK